MKEKLKLYAPFAACVGVGFILGWGAGQWQAATSQETKMQNEILGMVKQAHNREEKRDLKLDFSEFDRSKKAMEERMRQRQEERSKYHKEQDDERREREEKRRKYYKDREERERKREEAIKKTTNDAFSKSEKFLKESFKNSSDLSHFRTSK